MSDFAKRRKQLARLVANSSAQGLLVTNFNNVTYLTGFTGDDSFLMVTRDDCWLISDPRYEEQIAEECPGLRAHIRQPSELTINVTVGEIKKAKLGTLLIEGDTMTAGMLEQLREELKSVSIQISRGLVESLRVIKDKTEIDTIRLAVKMAERAFVGVRSQLRGDQSEREWRTKSNGRYALLAVQVVVSNRSLPWAPEPLCPTRGQRRVGLNRHRLYSSTGARSRISTAAT